MDSNKRRRDQKLPEQRQEDDQECGEALYAVGHWLFQQERYEDAAGVFRLLVRLRPRDERGWLALGECHRRAGHSHVALELFSAGAVTAEPAARCLLARYRLLRDLGLTEQARDALELVRHTARVTDDACVLDELAEEEQRGTPCV